MAPLTAEQVQEWVDDYLEAMSAPPDWKKIQELFNKRCTVEMPNEPRAKKFEDFKKKAEPFYAVFKGAKRSVPKGAKPIIVQTKKDEVEVIFPEQCLFTWTAGLNDIYTNCTLASGDKSKIFIYNRAILNSKKECTWLQPVFSNNDFKGADRADDADGLLNQIYDQFDAANERFSSDDLKVEFPVVGKMDKAQMFDLFAKFGGCQRELMKACPPVLMSTGKDEIFEGIVGVNYKLKWNKSLNDTFKLELAGGADVVLSSYDCIKIKSGKVISFAPHFDAQANIKPASKSGAA